MTLWGGVFSQGLDHSAWNLNASIDIDKRMALEDVTGSQAWANGLQGAGIISPDENQAIQTGLAQIFEEFKSGNFLYKENDEDIHTAVERRLGEIIGKTAGKLHTGRSRNDQVATDFRLWLMNQLPLIEHSILILQQVLVKRAETDFGYILPGYTHMQRAQPILLSHWWLSFFWALNRDRQKLAYIKKVSSSLPLGSGALAGTAFNIDREKLAVDLGFDAPSPNSLDSISDRDFAIEFLSFSSLLGIHLSRLAESLVLYTSAEFAYFKLADAYSTGSSLMPQKKNPDIFELTRGKSGVYIGNLMGLLTTLKGLPSIYDKDLQEDKHYVFSSFDTLVLTLPALAGAVETLTPNAQIMLENIDSSMLATDIADFLVKNGLPFREAHHVVGQIVQYSMKEQKGIDLLTKEELLKFHAAFSVITPDVLSATKSISNRACTGGTAEKAVKQQLKLAKDQLELLFV
ncbi:MAG: argininosuccinate lyase [Anaerolineae bacterium]|nr:argininosuccinate lyase [Anaerolineae bacterium]